MANQAGSIIRWLSAQSAFRQNERLWPVSPCGPENRIYVRGLWWVIAPTPPKHWTVTGRQETDCSAYLTGSHEPVSVTGPEIKPRLNRWHTEEVCYDNSIHYTDSLLGTDFAMLETRRASVMYFQITVWEYDPTKEHAYFHGGINPASRLYHVPMFIWVQPGLGEHVDRQDGEQRFFHCV